MTLDLVVFGNLLLDDVVRADGRTSMAQAGGAVLYVALAARLNGLDVGVVSVVGNDYPAAVLEDLAGRGIRLALRRLAGPGLRTWLLDEGRQRQVVHRLVGPTHAEVTPSVDDLPAAWREAKAFHLAPMPMALQRSLAESLSPLDGELSMDPYDLLRGDDWQPWRELADRVDILLLGEDEVLLSGDREAALRSLLGGDRLRQVLYKQGDRGGWVLSAEGRLDWRAEAASVVDTTGAGDAFAGGYLAGRLLGESPRRAARRGAVTAALAISAEGPRGLLHSDAARLADRLQSCHG